MPISWSCLHLVCTVGAQRIVEIKRRGGRTRDNLSACQEKKTTKPNKGLPPRLRLSKWHGEEEWAKNMEVPLKSAQIIIAHLSAAPIIDPFFMLTSPFLPPILSGNGQVEMSVAGGWTRKGGPAHLHLFGLSLRPFVTRKLNVAPKDGHEERRRRTVASPLAPGGIEGLMQSTPP